MTDSTKQLFDAPWVVMGDAEDYIKFNVIISSPNSPRHCCTIASCIDQKTVNRLARLPELYDALVETVYYKCFECMGGLRHNIDLTREELVKDGCPKQNKSNVCIYVKHLELLRKVRDGE